MEEPMNLHVKLNRIEDEKKRILETGADSQQLSGVPAGGRQKNSDLLLTQEFLIYFFFIF
jgi:hypothetical protein